MRLSAITLALAAAAPVVASNCKPIVPVDPRQCGTSVIGRDAEFTVNADKWNIQTDALSSYTFGTCNPYAQNACISYDFPVAEQTGATGSLSFSYTMSTPALGRGYRFFFYYRRTQEDAVDGTISCNFDGTQTQYDDSLVYQTANLWSLFALPPDGLDDDHLMLSHSERASIIRPVQLWLPVLLRFARPTEIDLGFS